MNENFTRCIIVKIIYFKTLTIPKLFPKRAVFCELKEAIAPIQHKDDPNAAKLCISGKLFIMPHV